MISYDLSDILTIILSFSFCVYLSPSITRASVCPFPYQTTCILLFSSFIAHPPTYPGYSPIFIFIFSSLTLGYVLTSEGLKLGVFSNKEHLIRVFLSLGYLTIYDSSLVLSLYLQSS